jgi:hypothetical protein
MQNYEPVFRGKSHWHESYTKQVCENLLRAYRENRSSILAVNDAVVLLEQYHRDMHVPYEQRDEARAEREEAYEVNRRLTMRLIEKDNEIVRLRALHEVAKNTIADLRKPLKWAVYNGERSWFDALKAQPKQVEYIACAHYPNAIHNHFTGMTHCEFCCEKEPLKWYDNGQHRQPKENQK